MFKVQELEHTLKIAAKVVVMYGDTYLPTFQRIYRELQLAKEHEANKALALKQAIGYAKP